MFKFNTKPFGHGFSFLELVIVLVIVSILGAIVYPKYQEHLYRGERSQAVIGLYQLQVWLEQEFTAKQSYPSDIKDCKNCKLAEQYAYSITISSKGYTLKATPKSGTMAEKDKACYIFEIDQDQVRQNITAEGNRINGTRDCWLQ
ncbi:MAG: type IV pilin protein [Enterovibrio sp.]